MDGSFQLQALRNLRCRILADARGQLGVNVIGCLLHALHDDGLAFPLWNLEELLPDLLFKNVIVEKGHPRQILCTILLRMDWACRRRDCRWNHAVTGCGGHGDF